MTADLKEAQKKLEMLDGIAHNLKIIERIDFNSIGDIAHIMKGKEKLRRVRTILLATAIPFTIMEWTSIFLWIFQGIWWPFAVYTMLTVPYVCGIFNYYWKNVSYICPQCHTIFKPHKKEAFFAKHTMTTRKLTCTCCGYQGFCIETNGRDNNAETEKRFVINIVNAACGSIS